MYTVNQLFDLTHTLAKDYLQCFVYPWEAVPGIQDFIRERGRRLDIEYQEISPQVWAHTSAKIAPTACICPPCIIGANTEIRHCAFLRGGALIGDGCVVGNSTELKNAILFDGVQAPHYNYVGDSILGFKAHMGAGSITSNVKLDKTLVVDTRLKKVGAMLGDFVEIGCNSVLNPGTVIGKGSTVYPLSCVRGTVAEYSIYKKQGEIAKKRG